MCPLPDIFVGWSKYSLVDYPNKISSVGFTAGCNFRCDYCHNKSLLSTDNQTYINTDTIFNYISKYRNMIDAFVITGGEPTEMSTDLAITAERFKYLFPDKLLKVDTNGTNPLLLERLADIIDYVAMDFKSLTYSDFSDVPLSRIRQCLKIIQSFKTYEVRLTVYPPYIKESDIVPIAKYLLDSGITKLYLQPYNPIDSKVKAYTTDTLIRFANTMNETGLSVEIKGLL